MKWHVAAEASPYYPPRARWYSRLHYAWVRLRSRLPEEWTLRVEDMPAGRFLMGLTLPGYGLILFGRRRLGLAVAVVYAALLMLFVLGAGFQSREVSIGSETIRFQPIYLGFGLMMAAHALSITSFIAKAYRVTGMGRRLVLGVGGTLLVGAGVYLPTLSLVHRFYMPLDVEGRLVWVATRPSPRDLRPDDWVAYRMHRQGRGLVILQAGYALAPVLALPGDRVRFTPNGVEVNSGRLLRLPGAPESGELTVPEKHWFIWPRLGINGHGVSPTVIAAFLQDLALVDEDQYVGRPLKRWFFRPQTLP
jgi:hypothetical protein